jgi:hypothetical protein
VDPTHTRRGDSYVEERREKKSGKVGRSEVALDEIVQKSSSTDLMSGRFGPTLPCRFLCAMYTRHYLVLEDFGKFDFSEGSQIPFRGVFT